MNKFYLLAVATVITAMISCDDGLEVKTTRTYRMGFQNSAARQSSKEVMKFDKNASRQNI